MQFFEQSSHSFVEQSDLTDSFGKAGVNREDLTVSRTLYMCSPTGTLVSTRFHRNSWSSWSKMVIWVAELPLALLCTG